jgi:hypothetical protein
MNRKQKGLTVFALLAFVLIGLAHYLTDEVPYRDPGGYMKTGHVPYIEDVRLPFFMLGVIYVGLFFLLADRKEKRP